MAFWINYAVRSSMKNPLTTSYKLSKHYSVLCSNKKNSSSNLFLNSKVPSSEKNLQFRYLSVEAIYSGLANSSSANFFINQLLNIHDCGIPWWATIALACASLRTIILFPMKAIEDKEITEMVNTREKEKANPHLIEKEILLLAKKNKWTQEKIIEEINRQEKKRRKKVVSESKLFTIRVVVSIFLQVSLWTFFSICIRKLCYMAEDDSKLSVEVLKYELQNEGVLWFKNLLNVDRYGLPLVLGITNLAILELLDLKRGTKTKLVTYIFRGITVYFVYTASTLPAAVSFLWAISVLTALGQTILLISPRFRKFVKLPPSPVDANHPFKVIRQRFKIKWGF